MKFHINYTNNIQQRLLTYVRDDYSFDMEPAVDKVDFELIINKLSLSVIDKKIIQLWGLCALTQTMKSECEIPSYKKGILMVEDILEHGFAYDIRKEELPIYINFRTGWVCIGSPEKLGNAVEFISNCVAVINDDGEFESLWLKPQSLPWN